jgi:uncharacterized protein involved in exopolysaccharide biosynthesis/Mrp family chromosome partitioning ATPase
MIAVNDTSTNPTQVGNPLLGQIRDFIDSDEPTPIDPVGIVARAIRGRLFEIAAAALAIAMLLALLTGLAIDPRYQSTGIIRILPREAKLLYADADDSRLRLYDAFTNAEVHLMQSRPVLESAWDALHHEHHEASGQTFIMPRDAGELGRIIKVTNRKGLVTVASNTRNRELSAAAVNAVLDAYESHKDAARKRVNDLRLTELQQRESNLTTLLEELDDRYLEIGGEHDLVSLSKAHITKTAQLEVLEERVSEIGNTIAQFQRTGSVGADDIRNAEIQRALLLDQAMAEMTYERASRLAELATLKRRYRPDHERILSAELELATLEEAIAERRDQITTLGNVGALTGGTGQSSQQSLNELESVRDKLVQRRLVLSNEASDLIGKLVKIRRVSAEQDRVSSLLDETKQALDEVVVESQAGLSRAIDIIARGKVPDRPIEDKRLPLAFGAALFGGLGTLIMFILASILNPRIRYSDELEPGLASKIAVVIPQNSGSDLDLQRAGLKLRNEIDIRRSRMDEPIVVGVAGVSASDDASAMAIHLGAGFAARELRVLLIDANSACRVTSKFAIDGKAGLANVMGGESSITEVAISCKTTYGHIDVLGTGVTRDEVSGDRLSTLAIQDFRSLISRAASHYDVVIVDLGELAAGRHSALGASVSDQLVLVTAAGDRKRSLRNATSLLDRLCPDRYALVFKRASDLDPMLEQQRKDPPYWRIIKNSLRPFRELLEFK